MSPQRLCSTTARVFKLYTQVMVESSEMNQALNLNFYVALPLSQNTVAFQTRKLRALYLHIRTKTVKIILMSTTTQTKTKVKAIALLSGGLDSTLAAKVVQQQGVDVEALHLAAGFCKPAHSAAPDAFEMAETIGIKIHTLDRSKELLELVKNPQFGYGSNMNPCIDCRIQMLKIAAEFMRKVGAKFLITGEVLGQRPMSQRRDAINLIEKQAGLRGLILRPLSAKLFDPTLPELEGWVNRDELPVISGRSRKQQIEMALQLGITRYPSPAGGCTLTDPQFSVRLRDLLKHCDATLNDMELLKHGRHFRLDNRTKAIVGRNQQDNDDIASLAEDNDTVIEPVDFAGPSALLRGNRSEDNVRKAAGLVVLYSKARTQPAATVVVKHGSDSRNVTAAPMTPEEAQEMVIA